MAVKMPRELNVTSYAILGCLAMRDWAAYDLTMEMQRNLVYFWPRAESAIYVEVKRLREAGLATSRVVPRGRSRRRTVYAITPKGREALRAWLAEPPRRGVLLESEGLLRLLLAGAFPPDPAVVLDALQALERDAAALVEAGLIVGREFIDGTHQFQDQVRWRAHINDFIVRYGAFVLEWTQQTRAMVAAWDRADESEIGRDAVALVADAGQRGRAAAASLPSDDNTTAEERDDRT